MNDNDLIDYNILNSEPLTTEDIATACKARKIVFGCLMGLPIVIFAINIAMTMIFMQSILYVSFIWLLFALYVGFLFRYVSLGFFDRWIRAHCSFLVDFHDREFALALERNPDIQAYIDKVDSMKRPPTQVEVNSILHVARSRSPKE